MSRNVNNKKAYVLAEFLNGKKKECAIIPFNLANRWLKKVLLAKN